MATGVYLTPSRVIRNVAGNVRRVVLTVSGSGDDHTCCGLNVRYAAVQGENADNAVGIARNSDDIALDQNGKRGFIGIDGAPTAECWVEAIGK